MKYLLSLLTIISFSQTSLAGENENFASYVKSNFKQTIEQQARDTYQANVNLDWWTLKCLGFGKVGTCLVSGDLNAPNSSGEFIINVTHPNVLEVDDYETVAVSIVLATIES